MFDRDTEMAVSLSSRSQNRISPACIFIYSKFIDEETMHAPPKAHKSYLCWKHNTQSNIVHSQIFRCVE